MCGNRQWKDKRVVLTPRCGHQVKGDRGLIDWLATKLSEFRHKWKCLARQKRCWQTSVHIPKKHILSTPFRPWRWSFIREQGRWFWSPVSRHTRVSTSMRWKSSPPFSEDTAAQCCEEVGLINQVFGPQMALRTRAHPLQLQPQAEGVEIHFVHLPGEYPYNQIHMLFLLRLKHGTATVSSWSIIMLQYFIKKK